MSMLRRGLRYAMNLAAMVSRQRGYAAGLLAGAGFIATVPVMLARYARWRWLVRTRRITVNQHPDLWSEEIVASLRGLGGEMAPYHIDVEAFHAHVAAWRYPRNYAGGPLNEGGAREEKLLEYVVSLDLLDVRAADVVIDVASEWSLFPAVLRRLTGATVYQQDLIYPPGLHGNYIGGSAARMPIPDGFADKLVLHNAFEHFEGTADSAFIAEAWRVLKPGGVLCILPLFVTYHHTNLTDPVVRRRGVRWDDAACVVDVPWWHNRFGRYYDAETLRRRVLAPGAQFTTTIYYTDNLEDVHRMASLDFALVMRKPAGATLAS